MNFPLMPVKYACLCYINYCQDYCKAVSVVVGRFCAGHITINCQWASLVIKQSSHIFIINAQCYSCAECYISNYANQYSFFPFTVIHLSQMYNWIYLFMNHRIMIGIIDLDNLLEKGYLQTGKKHGITP